MDALRLNIEHALFAIAADATRLLGNERNRVCLVKQTQLARSVLGPRRVEEHAALEQRPMKVRDHRADIARSVAASESAASQSLQIAVVRLGKCISIRLIHRIVLALLRHANVLVTQDVCANSWVERKTVNAIADAINEDR